MNPDLAAPAAPAPYQVAVVGLGKIGLPLAAQFAGRGARVIGCDLNPAVVTAVNAGACPIGEEPGLPERVAAAVAAGQLTATTATAAAVAASNVVVIIVPLLVDETHAIDFRAVDAATRDVAHGLRPGTLVLYETTLPVGTTRTRLGPLLAQGAGLVPGRDFALAFSPERVYSGRIFRDLATYPKIVGGVDAASTAAAVAFYRAVLDGAEVRPVRDAETAELVKLLETTYRDVNIALASEFARYAAGRGLPIAEAIAAANTQPYSHIHRPGIGVGGHCIPVYPYFLIHDDAAGDLTLPRAARQANDAMAGWALTRLSRALGGLAGQRILILGYSYREDVKEAAFSAAKPLIRELAASGATPLVVDPLFTPAELAASGAEVVALAALPPVDAVIVQAYHQAFAALDWASLAAQGARVVLDGRNALAPAPQARIRAAGLTYLGV
ncbi:MAG TPA: nucleotide sugar dehydrogenase [Chloroflexia bacterium]|nr:nucleotide sugar dehydrogenase [Chloroflexia bacterium]